MASIIRFDNPKGTVANAPEPNARLVNMLRDLLDRAEDGELQSLAIVGTTSDSGIVEGWTLSPDNPQVYAIIGALEVLKVSIMDTCIE